LKYKPDLQYFLEKLCSLNELCQGRDTAVSEMIVNEAE